MTAFEFCRSSRDIGPYVEEITIVALDPGGERAGIVTFAYAQSYLDFWNGIEVSEELQSRFVPLFDDLFVCSPKFSTPYLSFVAIETLYVRPLHRGQGLARAMLERIEADLQVLLPEPIDSPEGFAAESLGGNQAKLQHFYRSQGFEPLRRSLSLYWKD